MVQASEILGISDRSIQRWPERYEADGYAGLFDRRHHPSPQQVPWATVERVSAGQPLVTYENIALGESTSE